MPIGVGVFKRVTLKKQSALNVTAPAGAGGSSQYQRRVTSTVDLAKASFQSNEIRTSQQVADMRHGVKSVAGSLSQELSVGAHQRQFEAILRAVSVGPVTTGAVITIGATAGAAGSGDITLAASANNLLTLGFKVGDVVDVSGFATTGVANNRRHVIRTLVAGSMGLHSLDNVDGGTKVAGDTVTIATVGRKIAVPLTGHTRDYFTLEHWHSDIAQSELFTDCVFTGFNLNVPSNGMATVEFPVMGLNMVAGVAEYFTTPAVEASGGILAGINGAIVIDGVSVANVTSMTLNANGNYTVPGGVVGKNVDPDIFPGVLTVSGQMTVLFENATMRDRFINETIASVALVMVADNTANSPFTAMTLPKVKFGGAGKDDGQQGLTLTMPFTALQNTEGSAVLAGLNTTITIQDSAFT